VRRIAQDNTNEAPDDDDNHYMAQYTPSAVKPPTGTLADDGDLQPALPRICVDYLSHQWAEEDVWRSWRNMTRHKLEISNGLRLENASWRTWWKQRNKLKTVSPETLNWSVFLSISFFDPSPHFLLPVFLLPFFSRWGSVLPFVSWTAPRELAAAWMAHGICYVCLSSSRRGLLAVGTNGEAGASCELSPFSLAPATQTLARPNKSIITRTHDRDCCRRLLHRPLIVVLSAS
jgi:hypothetical protein